MPSILLAYHRSKRLFSALVTCWGVFGSGPCLFTIEMGELRPIFSLLVGFPTVIVCHCVHGEHPATSWLESIIFAVFGVSVERFWKSGYFKRSFELAPIHTPFGLVRSFKTLGRNGRKNYPVAKLKWVTFFLFSPNQLLAQNPPFRLLER